MNDELVRGGGSDEPGDPTYSIFIDGIYAMNSPIGYTGELFITSTGCYLVVNESTIGTWTFSGDGRFLGFSTTNGSSTPDSGYEVGDSINISSVLYLYSVALLPTLLTLNGNVLTSSGDIITYEDNGATGVQALTLNDSILTNNGNVLTYEASQ